MWFLDCDRWSRKKRNGTDAAKEAFERLDADDSGALDREEVRRLSEELGRALNPRELDAMLKELDEDGSVVCPPSSLSPHHPIQIYSKFSTISPTFNNFL